VASSHDDRGWEAAPTKKICNGDPLPWKGLEMQLEARALVLKEKDTIDLPGVVIRGADFEDAEALAELMSQLGYPTREDEMAARLRLILPCSDYLVAVAVREGHAVGVVAALMGLSIELNGRYGRVTALSVAEGQRGQGIGALLLAHAESWLRVHTAAACIVNCSTRRADAHRFYEREGYHVTGLRFHKDLRGLTPESHSTPRTSREHA
jgi:GNAT superfamily N-acetyltransferase